MDNIIEWLVDNCHGFAMDDWYPLDEKQQEEFKIKFKEQIMCQVYRHLDKYM